MFFFADEFESRKKEDLFKIKDAVYHISLRLKNAKLLKEIDKKLKEQFSDLKIMIMQDSFNEEQWLEIRSKNTSKYLMIASLVKRLHINNENIIAFGDAYNDIEIVKRCGVGVALNNALPAVKQVIKSITKNDYNNEGVIRFLQEYLHLK